MHIQFHFLEHCLCVILVPASPGQTLNMSGTTEHEQQIAYQAPVEQAAAQNQLEAIVSLTSDDVALYARKGRVYATSMRSATA